MAALDMGKLRAAVAAQPPGEFHLSDAVGPDWEDLWIGDKVKTGNAFLRAVRNGEVPGVADTGRKADGGRVYVKGEGK